MEPRPQNAFCTGREEIGFVLYVGAALATAPDERSGHKGRSYKRAVFRELVGVGLRTDALSPMWESATTFRLSLPIRENQFFCRNFLA